MTILARTYRTYARTHIYGSVGVCESVIVRVYITDGNLLNSESRPELPACLPEQLRPLSYSNSDVTYIVGIRTHVRTYVVRAGLSRLTIYEYTRECPHSDREEIDAAAFLVGSHRSRSRSFVAHSICTHPHLSFSLFLAL